MSYSYAAERPKLFTDEGQRDALKVLDHVRNLLSIAGAFEMQKAWKPLGSDDSWYALARVDRLVELGEIQEISPPYSAGQHRVFVAAHRS